MSVNDKMVLQYWNDSTRLTNGHYELSIPFKENPPQLSDNKPLADRRLQYLGNRLLKNEAQHQKYAAEITALVDKGFAEKVSEDTTNPGVTWYIPHHSVLNVNKPD